MQRFLGGRLVGFFASVLLTVGVTYVYDKAFNAYHGLSQAFAPDYRNFTHGVTGLGLQYKL